MEDSADDTAVGHAALSICHSLLIALQDLKIMSEKDARDILQDAATTHREAGTISEHPELHRKVAAIIDRMIAGGNGFPWP
jgi:hypothetical protein